MVVTPQAPHTSLPCPRLPSVMGLLSSWSEPMPVRGLLLCSESAREEISVSRWGN